MSLFDSLTAAGKYVLTRQKEKVRYRVTRVLSQGSYYKDEIIHMGLHHTHPCHNPMRLVSVLWGKNWYYYLRGASSNGTENRDKKKSWKINSSAMYIHDIITLACITCGYGSIFRD